MSPWKTFATDVALDAIATLAELLSCLGRDIALHVECLREDMRRPPFDC